MRQRLGYLIKYYLLTVVIFIAAKVGFMLMSGGEHPFTMGDLFDVIWHGLSLDLSTALYVFALPFLCLIVSIWYPHEKFFRWILRPYSALIAIAFALAFVADTSLYEFWGFKLDATCLQYLETPTEAMASVSTGYMVLRILVIILLATLFTWAYWHINLKLPKIHHRILATIAGLITIPLIVIGIRGGLDESTTNIGQVYYSQNQFLNHSAVNPVFSFMASMEKTANYVPDYSFMAESECAQLMEGFYFTDSTEPDTLLKTQRPNVIVILLESCGGIFTEDIVNISLAPTKS